MQETFDFYTLIIIVTFLGVLLFIAYFINKKNDFLKTHLNKHKSIGVTTSFLLGAGNRATVFEIDNNKFLVVSNKNSISNILPILNNVEKNNNDKEENEKYN